MTSNSKTTAPVLFVFTTLTRHFEHMFGERISIRPINHPGGEHD